MEDARKMKLADPVGKDRPQLISTVGRWMLRLVEDFVENPMTDV
jgi:hypothetical protein